MRRLIGFVVFVAIVILAIGFWRGWFTLLVNRPQIQQDTQKIGRKFEHEADKLKGDVNKGAKKIEENTNNPTPPIQPNNGG